MTGVILFVGAFLFRSGTVAGNQSREVSSASQRKSSKSKKGKKKESVKSIVVPSGVASSIETLVEDTHSSGQVCVKLCSV